MRLYPGCCTWKLSGIIYGGSRSPGRDFSFATCRFSLMSVDAKTSLGLRFGNGLIDAESLARIFSDALKQLEQLGGNKEERKEKWCYCGVKLCCVKFLCYSMQCQYIAMDLQLYLRDDLVIFLYARAKGASYSIYTARRTFTTTLYLAMYLRIR